MIDNVPAVINSGSFARIWNVARFVRAAGEFLQIRKIAPRHDRQSGMQPCLLYWCMMHTRIEFLHSFDSFVALWRDKKHTDGGLRKYFYIILLAFVLRRWPPVLLFSVTP